MDRARFDAIIAAYGAEPRRWPADERVAAEAFCASARVDLGEAAALDQALDRAHETLDVSLVSARILKQRRGAAGRTRAGGALGACGVRADRHCGGIWHGRHGRRSGARANSWGGDHRAVRSG
ncbi:MAG: hypothetical protein WDN76_06725 [Alphaproteobacteria bacterium]